MPAPTKVQLIGGHFQDAEGNVLALGHLAMELVQDEQLSSSTGQVCGGIKVLIKLDSGGSVDTAPPQSVWPTDVMSPAGAYYTVWGYAANGELAWGPNYNLLVPSGATFDVDNWLPNSTGGGSGSGGSSIQLQVEGVNNAVQTLLNLESLDGSVVITDEGNGSVNFQAGGGDPAKTRYTVPSLSSPSTFYDVPGSSFGTTSVTIGSGPFTIVQPTVGAPGYLKGTSGSSTNFNVGIATTAANTTPRGPVKSAQISGGVFNNANVRIWVLTFTTATASNSNNGFLELDAPLFDMVGFRYSTAAGDTHWMAICNLADGTQTLVDTGITPDATGALHTFETQIAQGVPGTVLFLIDGTQVASISTHVPSATASYGFLFSAEVLASTPVAIAWNKTVVTLF